MPDNDRRPVIFGEVLFDCFPDGKKVLGGAPFNVAWHLHAFGLNPLFISAIGDDESGQQIMSEMQRWGMDTSGLQVSENYPTGKVSISLDNGEPSYDIVDQQAYDFVSLDQIPRFDNAALFYHGSLALRNPGTRATFEYLCNSYNTPRFLDVNLRQPWVDFDYLRQLLQEAHWLKLNQDELHALAGPQSGNGQDNLALARQLIMDYRLNSILLTKGEQGADFIDSDTVQNVVPEYQDHVVDTVGAGDAFTSVILAGLIQGWDMPSCLNRAQAFASRIVGRRGATVDDAAFYDEVMAGWMN